MSDTHVSLEKGFLSAVVYLDGADNDLGNTSELAESLSSHFENYEIVFVFDGASDAFPKSLSDAIAELPAESVTVVFMGQHQGMEASMNAGIDLAVGDYILEVDDASVFDAKFVMEAYREVSAGADIVMGISSGSFPWGGGVLFYPLFNAFTPHSGTLASGSCRFVSRRALNRVHNMHDYMPYRKASYAASGMRCAEVHASRSEKKTHRGNIGIAIDGLALYTDLFFKASFGLTIAMAILSFCELIYVLAVLLNGMAIQGWATTMFVLTLGFLGVFLALTFVMKYLELLVKSAGNNQRYLVEKVERAGNLIRGKTTE